MTPTVTVTGPFEADSKADKPVWRVIVKRGDFVDPHDFPAADGSTSSKADAKAKAEAFADGERAA